MAPGEGEGRGVPPVRVHVASILHDYTGGASDLESSGRTVRAVLSDLDRRFPGLFFRLVDEQDVIRPHIKVYVNEKLIRSLSAAVPSGAEVHVLQALSGG